MKMKGFAVIGLLVLGCSFAAAGSWTFNFGGDFCDYLQINNNNTDGVAGIPVNGPVYEGFHILSVCGLSYNATVSGFGPYTLPKGVTFIGYKVVVSKGVVFGDNIYDAFSDAYTGEQWTLATALTCLTGPPKKNNKDWWIGVASFSNFVFGDNAGPLFCGPMVPGKHGKLLTTGQLAK